MLSIHTAFITLITLVLTLNVSARFPLLPGSTRPHPNNTTLPPQKLVYDPPIDYGPDDGVTPEIQALLRKYAPIIYLHSEEDYFPSSVEFLMKHFQILNGRGLPNATLPEGILTSQDLATLPLERQWDLWLSLSIPINAQPKLDAPESAFLYGPDGQTEEKRLLRRLSAEGIDGIVVRPKVKAPVYAFHVQQEQGFVDLIYWTHYPFNLGKKVPPLGYLGNHVGDWEHFKLRTKDGVAISADYMVHRDLSATGTMRWGDVPKYDGRPVAFSALGSHGLWPTAGEHLYINAFNIIKLIDVTDDQGPVWDSRDELVPIQWSNTSAMRNPYKRRHDPRGKLGWLNFSGRWGNKGVKSCWWSWISPDCQNADAPQGPNRDFRRPPQCIIAPLNNDPGTSIFKFTLDPAMIYRANHFGMRYLELSQTCSRWRETKAGSQGAGNDALNDMVTQGQLASLAAREDVKLRTRVPLLLRDNHFEATTRSCPPHHAISSYTLTMCNARGKCRWHSGRRDVCTYLRGTNSGYTNGRSVILDDTDPWTWFNWPT